MPVLFSSDYPRDGIRESVVVTKIFDVEVVENPNSPTDDHENRYLFEIQEEKKVIEV